MRMRWRGFLVRLLVTCIVFSQLTYYGQERPPEEEISGKSLENAQKQRDLEESGLTQQQREEKHRREFEGAMACPGCTPEERWAGKEVAATIRAAKARNAEAEIESENKKLPPSIHTFLVAPTNSAQYARIFGAKEANPQNTTMAQLREIRRIRQQMQADFGNTTGGLNLNSSNVGAAIVSSRSSFVLLVGHNDRGSFRFVDGSSLELDDLVAATRPDQRMIIVSCSAKAMLSNQAASKTAATQDDLTYPQAFQIAKTIQEYVASAGPQVSLEMVRQALQSAESKSALRYNVSVFARPIAVGGVVSMVIALVISGRIPCLRKNDCR